MGYEEFKIRLATFNGTFENGEVMFTSKDIAELVGEEHRNVIRDINGEVNSLKKDGVLENEIKDLLKIEDIFIKDEYGRNQPAIKFNSQGVRQIISRYSSYIGYELNKKLLSLENIAKFGGKEISNIYQYGDF